MTHTRHLVLPMRVLILVGVLVVAFLLLVGQVQARTDQVPPTPYTVVSGDTLWGIADGLTSPGGDVRATVYRLRKLNGLTNSSLRPGQVLLIPGD